MIETVFAIFISFFIVILAMPKVIPFLTKLKMGQAVRELGPESHYKKAGTPTMGGLIIMFAMLITSLMFMFANKSDGNMVFALFVTLIFGLIGFLDDYIQMVQKQRLNSDKGVLVPYLGMQPRQKLILQFSVALAISVYAAFHPEVGTDIIIPFTNLTFDLGMIYIPFVTIAIVAVVNAANLTDGLDGLAAGVTFIILSFFLVTSIVLRFESLGIFAGSAIGSCLGFLCFNSHPARIFMGDTGSMALGGAVVIIAILTKTELFILIAGAIYVIEALSVLLQMSYFKLTGGKRLLKMAPLHHHFELMGINETKIVVVFWVITFLLVLISLTSIPAMIT